MRLFHTVPSPGQVLPTPGVSALFSDNDSRITSTYPHRAKFHLGLGIKRTLLVDDKIV